MAVKTIQVRVCDICGDEKSVRTHTVRSDRRTAELEACGGCWDPIKDVLDKAIGVGRRINVPERASSKRSTSAKGASAVAE